MNFRPSICMRPRISNNRIFVCVEIMNWRTGETPSSNHSTQTKSRFGEHRRLFMVRTRISFRRYALHIMQSPRYAGRRYDRNGATFGRKLWIIQRILRDIVRLSCQSNIVGIKLIVSTWRYSVGGILKRYQPRGVRARPRYHPASRPTCYSELFHKFCDKTDEMTRIWEQVEQCVYQSA